MSLRHYQQHAVEQITVLYEQGVRRVLLVMPTGAGKTHTAAHVMRLANENGVRSLFVAHREDLITRTLERLHSAGIHAGRIQAGYDREPLAPVQVASASVATTTVVLPAVPASMVDGASNKANTV